MKKLTLLAFLASTAVPAFAIGISNGGFETGNFSGWGINFPGLASVVTSDGTYSPVEGSYFARVSSGGGAGVYTILSQTFSVASGDTVSGSAGFRAEDYLPFNDGAFLNLIGPSGTVTLWTQIVATVGDFGSSGWNLWSSGALAAGSYQLQFGVRNALDNIGSSVAFLDDVHITSPHASVPDGGSTIALCGLAMTAIGVVRRRFGV